MLRNLKTQIFPLFSIGILLVAVGIFSTQDANAAPVEMGSTANFAVLAATSITNSGVTDISGFPMSDIGVSPGSTISDLGTMTIWGTQHINDAEATSAQTDLSAAFAEASLMTPELEIDSELGGTTLLPGVYSTANGEMQIGGTVTLDGNDDLDSIFVLKANTNLTSANTSYVELINGAQACNVIWVVGNTVTLGADSVMAGRIMAQSSIIANSGAIISGQLLSRDGAISLNSNFISSDDCFKYPTDTWTGTEDPTDFGSETPSTTYDSEGQTPTGEGLPDTSSPWTNLMSFGVILMLSAVVGIILRHRIRD